MKPLDPEVLREYFELKKQYIAKYYREGLQEFEIFPDEYYSIQNYAKLSSLLKKALQEDKRLEELDYFQRMHETNIQKQITEGIEELRKQRSR